MGLVGSACCVAVRPGARLVGAATTERRGARGLGARRTVGIWGGGAPEGAHFRRVFLCIVRPSKSPGNGANKRRPQG